MEPPKPTVSEVVAAVASGYQPDRIILFGSAARGTMDSFSDVDLLIVKSTDQPFLQRVQEAGRACPPGIDVDCFVYTPSELEAMLTIGNAIVTAALETGRVVYEKPRA